MKDKDLYAKNLEYIEMLEKSGYGNMFYCYQLKQDNFNLMLQWKK